MTKEEIAQLVQTRLQNLKLKLDKGEQDTKTLDEKVEQMLALASKIRQGTKDAILKA